MSCRSEGRREFLASALTLGGTLLIGGPGLARAERGAARPSSKVVVAREPGLLRTDRGLDREGLRNLLDRGLARLLGERDGKTALRRLLRPSARVGLKVNCLAGRGLSTHRELVEVLGDVLEEAGIREQDILVWDRSDRDLHRAGFRINRGGPGPRCYGTEQDYEPRIRESGSIGSCFSRLLTRECDLLINLPILKDHDLAGISGGMKNFYGAIHNPNKYHDHNCSPYIADLYAHPQIRSKVVLTICDALRPQCDGGPAYLPGATWPMGGLILARDPVAADWTAWRIVEAERKGRGLRSLAQDGRAPAWIEQAEQLGLGLRGKERVQVIDL